MTSLLRKLNVQAGEERIVLLLFLHSLFIGGMHVFGYTAAWALFLDVYGAETLPYAYIIRALLVGLTGYFLSHIESKVSMKLMTSGTLIFLLVAAVLLWFGLTFTAIPVIAFLVLLWNRECFILVNFTFWRLAGSLMTIQQAKRLFGVVGSGEIITRIFGYALIPFIITAVGTRNLMLLSAISIGISLIFLFALFRQLPKAEDKPAHEELFDDVPLQKTDTRGYRRVIALLTVVVGVVYILIDFGANEQFGLQVQDADSLSRLLAIVYFVLYSAGLVTRMVIAPWVLKRFSVRTGLLILPVLTVVLLSVIILADNVFGMAGAIFVIVMVAKILEEAFRMSHATMALLLYQPLAKSERGLVQAQNDVILNPLATIIAGVFLLIVRQLGLTGTAVWTIPSLLLTIGWVIFTLSVAVHYRATLRDALTGRLFNNNALTIDQAGMGIILEKLHSSHAGEVVHALELLEKWGTPAQQTEMLHLLDHHEPLIKQQVMKQVARLNMQAALPEITQRLKTYQNEAVIASAVEAMCTLGDETSFNEVQQYVSSPSSEIGKRALVGLMRNGGQRATAVKTLRLLQQSDAPSERQLVADVLGEVGNVSDFELLLPLFEDEAVEVRQSAVFATGKLKHQALWPHVVRSLDDPVLRPTALRALEEGDVDAMPTIEAALKVVPDDVAAGLLQIAGQIGDSRARVLLMSRLSEKNSALRHATFSALLRAGYLADSDNAIGQVREQINVEMAHVVALLDVLNDVNETGHEDAVSPLQSAILAAVKQSRQQTFTLLSLLYSREDVAGIAHNLSLPSLEKQAYALEVMDILLPRDLHSLVAPLLSVPENMLGDVAHMLTVFLRISNGAQQSELSLGDRLALLVEPNELPSWLGVCALYAIGRLRLTQLTPQVEQASWSSDAFMAAQANWTLRQFADPDKDQPEISLVEQVYVLKNNPLFANIADDLLAKITSALKEDALSTDERLFEKGAFGTEMYFVVSGKLKAHDGALLYNYIREKEVVGEMAALDPAPRSASVTAVEPTRLLCLGQPSLDHIMSVHPEIGRGITAVLSRRLRDRVQDLGALQYQIGQEATILIE